MMADEPVLNARAAKQELKRLGLAILAVVLILIGGLIAINQWLIEPRSFGDLRMVVSDRATGRPCTGAFVELFDASGAVLATGQTDEKGYYEQGRMAEGKFRVRISVPGYHPVVREFEVLAGEATRLTLVLVPEAPPIPKPSPPAPMPLVAPPQPVAPPAAPKPVAVEPPVAVVLPVEPSTSVEETPQPQAEPQPSPAPQTSPEPPAQTPGEPSAS